MKNIWGLPCHMVVCIFPFPSWQALAQKWCINWLVWSAVHLWKSLILGSEALGCKALFVWKSHQILASVVKMTLFKMRIRSKEMQLQWDWIDNSCHRTTKEQKNLILFINNYKNSKIASFLYLKPFLDLYLQQLRDYYSCARSVSCYCKCFNVPPAWT